MKSLAVYLKEYKKESILAPLFKLLEVVFMTTSGTHCPFLGYPAAMALVDIGFKDPGTALEVDVRGRRVAAEVVKLPFYKRQ